MRRPSAAVGGRRLLVGLRRHLFTAGAIGDRFGAEGALQLGLIGLLLCRVARHLVDRECADHRLAGPHRVHVPRSSCRRRCAILVSLRPSQRTKAIAIWAGVAGVRARSDRWRTAGCSATSGSVASVNIPFVSSHSCSGRSSCPCRAIGGSQLISSARSFDRRHLGDRLRIDPGARRRMDERRATRRVRRRAHPRRVRVVESRVDEPMLDMKYFQIPHSARGPRG